MNILVVGGAGNLGRGLVKNLELGSHSILVWDKNEGISNLSTSILEDGRIDLIVNLSVVANLKQKEVRISDSDYLVNVIGLSHLVNLSEVVKIPLIHISTREVIGVRDFRLDTTSVKQTVVLRAISETEPCLPLHSYGKTKLISEFVMQGCSQGSVIRLNTCYTDLIKSGAGLIANLVNKSRQESRVILDNDGRALRDPLHINDLSSLILKIYHSNTYGEIFHAGGGSDNIVSLREICELANSDVLIQSGNTSHDYGFVMDISKAEGLGWRPSIKFREWVESTL